MIRYTVACACGNRFTTWFKSMSGADEDLCAGRVTCPACGGHDIAKAPMAPGIATTGLSVSPPDSASSFCESGNCTPSAACSTGACPFTEE